MPEVSVIIPTFNRSQKVLRALASVLYQTFRDYEVVVVNDGSTDGTERALEPFFPNIRYLLHTNNRGVSAARNSGIRISTSPFLAFLDSDDYWLPEKLSTQVAFFKSIPRAVACQTEEIWRRRGRRVNPKKKHIKPSGDIFASSLERCMVSPSTVMLRRSLLDEVGLFDETLPACEDYDLWLRIACRYPIDLIKTFLAVKEGGHHDQLSSNTRGLDRLRIQSLVKLLRSGNLSREQRDLTLKALTLKCRIYGQGCMKRGKDQEGLSYLHLPKKIRDELSLE